MVMQDIPRGKEALVLDKRNDYILWADAIVKEMCSVQCVLVLKAWGYIPSPGHKFIKYHIIFDVKIEYLRCKARMDAGDQMNQLKSCRR